jgi:hypothetical protein
MNDIIKFCKQNLPDVEFEYAKLFFKNASVDAKRSLEGLCRHNKNNMTIVLRGIVIFERIKAGKDKQREIAKIEKKYTEKFEKAYNEAASTFIRLHPERKKELVGEFKKFFSFITQPTAYDPIKRSIRSIKYNSVLKDLVKALEDEYPRHTRNSILNGLSELLNELDCKSLQNKPFTRQILHSLINS